MSAGKHYRIAVLDDYQDAARQHADRKPVRRDGSVTVFRDTLRSVPALA